MVKCWHDKIKFSHLSISKHPWFMCVRNNFIVVPSVHLLMLPFLPLLLFMTTSHAQSPVFRWPEGKRAAFSLSFDDARLSNIDVGLPLFKKWKAAVTYYVVPGSMEPRKEGWKQAVKDGHEIGNHTLVHPCTGNFAWSRTKALENYTLESMRAELVEANRQIKEMLGVEPVSFAYPCGQTYVGSGLDTRSYVPLVAELFTSGRGWLDENANDPNFVDLPQLLGMEMDGKDFQKDILPLLLEAVKNGSWLVLAGHEIGQEGRQTTRVKMLEELLAYVQSPESGIWMAPVGAVADYVNVQRQSLRLEKLQNALTFCATFDKGFDADFSLGESQLYTAPSYDSLEKERPGMHIPAVHLANGLGLFGSALQFDKKTEPVLFYKASKNIAYASQNWNGAISLWLRLNPEADLEPGYCDPIQITDMDYNDAALWVDFSNKNPRDFRMGVYGDLMAWNPDNIGPDENPNFLSRLLQAQHRPFSREKWTHIVVSFSGLNAASSGKAWFYVNGQLQGVRQIPEPFNWEIEKAKIFLGLNYTGLMDEVALFNQPLTKEEVMGLYKLEGGVKALLRKP